jgi:hypothetical protein
MEHNRVCKKVHRKQSMRSGAMYAETTVGSYGSHGAWYMDSDRWRSTFASKATMWCFHASDKTCGPEESLADLACDHLNQICNQGPRYRWHSNRFQSIAVNPEGFFGWWELCLSPNVASRTSFAWPSNSIPSPSHH